MGEAPRHDVTQLLEAISDGDSSATDRLLPLVYDELRNLAELRMKNEPPGHTLQATALVHEAYLRLVGNRDEDWDNRGHFFSAAARCMRRILVERARKHARIKHGGGRHRVEFNEELVVVEAPSEDLIALDEALDGLEALDKRKSDVVMLRYFAGLTVDETARVVGVSPATVKNDWNFAKAWLYHEVCSDDTVGH